MKKRILFLISNTPLSLQVNTMNMLLHNQKYRIHLLYYDRGSSIGAIPLHYLVDPKQCSAVQWPVGKNPVTKFVNRLIVILLFLRQIKQLKPDVIHAWNLDMLLAARLATIRMKHIKIVFTLRITTEWMTWLPIKVLQRWAYQKTNLIFVTSQGYETLFLRKYKLIDSNKEIVFIPNVPPSQQFVHFKPRKPDNTLTVGYIGTIRGSEGIESLVQATKLARESGADVHLLFAGTGKNRSLVEDLSEKHPFVEYHGPYRYDQKILDIYRQVDVLYALYDRSYDKKIHFAYRLSDAIHCRLPIIVAKGTHMAEIVDTLEIGVSIELGNIEELARALEDLAYSPVKRIQFAHNCEKALPEFVFERYQETINTAYDNLWVVNHL